LSEQQKVTRQSNEDQIAKGALVVSIFTFLSRILGFFRDILVARLFGTGIFADAYYVAFRIPNLLRSLFAEGAFTSAFVPVFSEAKHISHHDAQFAFSSILKLLLLLTAGAAFLGILFSSEIVDLIAPGFSAFPEKRESCIALTKIMMPYIIFVSLVTLQNALLNTYNIYGSASLAQVIMNATLILGAIIAGFVSKDTDASRVLAYSVILGGIVQVLFQLPSFKSINIHFSLRGKIFSKPVKETLKLFLPALLGSTVYQLSVFLSTFLASLLTTGSITWLFYADRLTQFPIGVFTISVASVLLPQLSKAAVLKDEARFNAQLEAVLRCTNFIIIPTAAVFFYYSESIVSLLFERGDFTSYSTEMTALAVSAQALGIWSISLHSMITRAFIAKKNVKIPTAVGVLSLILTLLLSLLFMGDLFVGAGTDTNQNFFLMLLKSFQHALPLRQNYRHAGLALSTTMAGFVSFFVLLSLFLFKYKEFNLKGFLISSIICLGAATAAISIAASISYASIENHVLNLFVQLGSVVLLYVFFHTILKTSEIQETRLLISRLLKKFR
jgi:putative peptidoglycan lipid II flippase